MRLIIGFVLFLWSNYTNTIDGQFSKRNINIKEENFLVSKTVNDFYDLTNLLPANYVKDGSVDYTKYLQDGINSHFQENSCLIIKPNDKKFYNIILVEGVNNVKIFNPNLLGDRTKHKSKLGEWGYGIYVLGSSNVEIYNAKIKNCWGDALVISDSEVNMKSGKNYMSKNILIDNFLFDYNRRNAVSILGGQDITLKNGKIYNTMGVAPKAAIMIEPNSSQNKLKNVTIDNIYMKNNVLGIGINLNKFTNNQINNQTNLKISRIEIVDGITGIQFAGFDSKPKKMKIEGEIYLNDISLKNIDRKIIKTNSYQIYPNITLQRTKVFKNSSYNKANADFFKDYIKDYQNLKFIN